MTAPVRTHSVRQVVVDAVGVTLPESEQHVVCRGCGTRWPIEADLFALSRTRCGTRVAS